VQKLQPPYLVATAVLRFTWTAAREKIRRLPRFPNLQALHPLLLIAWLGCGGDTIRNEYVVSEAGPSLGAGGHLGAGGNVSGGSGNMAGGAESGGAGSVDASMDGQSGAPANGGSSGGGASDAAGTAGETGSASDASDADAPNASDADARDASDAEAGDADALPCLVPPDCPTPANPCIVATCVRGRCGVRYLDAGSVHILDTPADCHAATSCDGLGHAVSVVDQSNAPTPSNPCLAGTCNSAGTPGTEPLPARTPCSSYPNAMICDGAGRCVACLRSVDCPAGQSCDKSHSCVSLSCTDVDCGGVCLPCALGKKCIGDYDCVSGACDALTLICITDRCADHRRDGNETDVDCSGSCAQCLLGQGCNYHDDCATHVCDGLSHVCVTDPCADHFQDFGESDVDCGGSNACSRCASGARCTINSDCQSAKCNFRNCQ